MAVLGTSKLGESELGAQAAHPYLLTPGKLMWVLEIDWDGDGVLRGDIELQTFTEMKWKRGRKARMKTDGQGQEHPDQETFWIVIQDDDARYDSFNDASPLYNYLGATGMLMRIVLIPTTQPSKGQVVFTGTLASASYDAQTGKSTLIGEGCARLFQIGYAEHIYNVCQSDSLVHRAWDSYFTLDAGSTPFPVNWWYGRPDGLWLRECVKLLLKHIDWPFGMYDGQTVYSTDRPDFYYLTGQSAWQELRDLADAFVARLFPLRDGKIFMMDRQDALGLPGSETPLDVPQEADGLQRESPYEGLRNSAEVRVRPHAVQTPFKSPYLDTYYTTVWSNAGPIAVPPSSIVSLDVEYLHNGNVVAGNWLTVLDSYEAWSQPDKTGTNMGLTGTGDADTSLATEKDERGLDVPYGNNQCRTRLNLVNSDAVNTAYYFNLAVGMIGILETGQAAVESSSDAPSIAANGQRMLTIDLPWVQNTGMGQNIAQAYVGALRDRQSASPATLGYKIDGDSLFSVLTNYDMGSIVNFGNKGGATALANFGMYGRWVIVCMELAWVNADGQMAHLSVAYEKLPPVDVEIAGSVSTGTANGATSVTFSHTVPSGSDRLLVVQVGLRALQSVSGVTFGGIALTKLGHVQYAAGNYARAEIWYKIAPAVSTANVVVSVTGSEQIEAGALNFVNVHQTTPMGAMASASGIGTSDGEISVASALGDMVVDVLIREGGTLTPDTSQTSRWAASADSNWKGGGSTEAAGANNATRMSWVLTGANAWVLAGVAIKSISN